MIEVETNENMRASINQRWNDGDNLNQINACLKLPSSPLRQTDVRVATVHEQQARQEAKLRDRVVGRVARLQALLAGQSDADVRRLDHRHVVGAVADRERDGAELDLGER